MSSNKLKEHKEQLKRATEDYEDILNEDLTIISETAKDWGAKILLVGGVMLVSYLGVRAIIGKGRKAEEEPTHEIEVKKAGISTRDIFIKSLSDKAALVLLALIREYIVKLLSDTSDKDEGGNTQ